MSDRRRAVWWTAAVALLIVLVALLGLLWNAGGPQPMREITKPVAVPALPR